MCVGSRSDDRWPVMVWFHGGDFNTGTPAIWDASIFVSKQKVRYGKRALLHEQIFAKLPKTVGGANYKYEIVELT